MAEGLYKKWWCLRDLYEQPPEVLFCSMSKKTIRIFAFKNKEKKCTLLIYIRFLQKKLVVRFLRASPAMLKNIFHIQVFSYILFFATPLVKLKLGQQIANHVHQLLWSTNQKHWVAVRSYLLHSFLQVHSSFTSLQ
jgi:hypothetical protein